MAIGEKEFNKKIGRDEIERIGDGRIRRPIIGPIDEDGRKKIPIDIQKRRIIEGPDISQKLEGYIPILTKLRNFFKSTSTVPTANPPIRLDQEVLYESGGVYRIYKFIKDAWKKVYDSGEGPGWFKVTEVLEGSAVQTIVISGLDLDAAETYNIIITSSNDSGGVIHPKMFVNGDFTVTNYFNGRVRNGTYVGGNDAYIATDLGDTYPWGFNLMMNRLTGDEPHAWGNGYSANNAYIMAWFHNVVGNVTSITMSAGAVDGFGAGTKVKILKLTN